MLSQHQLALLCKSGTAVQERPRQLLTLFHTHQAQQLQAKSWSPSNVAVTSLNQGKQAVQQWQSVCNRQ
jgi:hypothetical protein